MEKEKASIRRATGKYVSVAFSTVLQSPEGKQKTVRIKTRIHYREKGEGPVLLLLHDAGQSSETFRQISSALAAEYRVITPDLPGHGYSGCPDMDYTTEDFTLFIEAFLKAMHIGEASIVAYGQSAAYAIDYCSYNRDSVRRLVLISPGSLRMQDFGSARYLGSFFGKWIVRRYQNPVYMRKQIEKAFFDKTALQEQDVRAYCKPYTRTEVQECVQMTVANFEDNKVAGQLGALELPILFMRGGEDVLSDTEAAEHYMQAATQPYEMVIRNCGAWIQLEKPGSVSAGILRFLQG